MTIKLPETESSQYLQNQLRSHFERESINVREQFMGGYAAHFNRFVITDTNNPTDRNNWTPIYTLGAADTICKSMGLSNPIIVAVPLYDNP